MNRTSPFSNEDPAGPFAVSFYETFSEVEDVWRALEESAAVTVYQNYDWQHTWQKTVGEAQGAKPLLIVVTLHETPVLLIPLIILTQSGVTKATWLGGDHANYRMALTHIERVNDITRFLEAELIHKLKKAPLGVDLLDLPQQPISWDGVRNPLAGAFPSITNPATGSSVTLEADFSEVLARGNAKRKRKKLKAQEKALNAMGGYQVANHTDGKACANAYDIFLKQKLPWFRSRGIKTEFSDNATTSFFKTLADLPDEKDNNLLNFTTIEANGTTLAVLAHGSYKGTLYGYFTSISGAEKYQSISPGALTFYKVIEEACDAKLARFDFGVGGERYKDQWCDEHHELVDVMIPLTMKGRLYASVKKLKTVAKRQIKENEAVWHFTKRLRSQFLGKNSA